ncbi:MAG: hypothetical protein DMF55_01840 [Acidobacteria bacterium]|nr:MAG: hypothetical protein DMF55_01840 [Acidobacteriota bacterium]
MSSGGEYPCAGVTCADARGEPAKSARATASAIQILFFISVSCRILIGVCRVRNLVIPSKARDLDRGTVIPRRFAPRNDGIASRSS